MRNQVNQQSYPQKQLSNQKYYNQNPFYDDFYRNTPIKNKNRNKTPDPSSHRYNQNTQQKSNQRNNRFTNSFGMINSIYPDWWCSQENLNDNFENDDDDNHGPNNFGNKKSISMTNIKNKHFSQKLSLMEKKAIIERSRRDNTSSGSGLAGGFGGFYARDRAASNINTRDRIYDRVQRVNVSTLIFIK